MLLRTLALLVTGIVAGAMSGIWLGFDPHGFSFQAYVEHQQQAIRSLNVLMPVLGATSIALTLVLALAGWRDMSRVLLLGAAAALMIGAGLVTRSVNQPLDAAVMTWRAEAPPADWTSVRDRWWDWHIVRTASAVGSFLLLILGTNPERRR